MKKKYINSISLLAVCAVLSGCSGSNNAPKSAEELKSAIIMERQELGNLAGEVLSEARQEGVPLPPAVEAILKSDMTSQTDIPLNQRGLVAELSRATEELTTLLDSGAYVNNEGYWSVVRKQADTTRNFHALLLEQIRVDREYAERTEIDYPPAPNNSFAGEPVDGLDVSLSTLSNTLSRSNSAVAGVDGLYAILSEPDDDDDALAPTPQRGSGDGSTASVPPLGPGSLRVLGGAASNQQIRVPGEGRVYVRTDADGLSDELSGIFAAYTGIGPAVPNTSPVSTGGAPKIADSTTAREGTGLIPNITSAGTQPPYKGPIDAAEAVRQGVVARLKNTHVTGGELQETASPKTVDAVRKASVLAFLNGTPEFKELNPTQQQLAVELVSAQSITGGAGSDFQSRFRAMLRAVALIGTIHEGDNKAVLRARLTKDGFTNDAIETETLRVYDMLARFYIIGDGADGAGRFNRFVQVLMVANKRTLTDLVYSETLTEISENPSRSIAETAARYGLPPEAASLIEADVIGFGTNKMSLPAIQEAARHALKNGSVADPSQTALVSSVENRRLTTTKDKPKRLTNTLAIQLADALHLLPARTALDMLAEVHRREVTRLSSALGDLRLAIGDKPSTAPDSGAGVAAASEPKVSLPNDPKVEVANFTQKCKTFTGALSKDSLGVTNHKDALITLQTSIKDVTVPTATQFKEFPFKLNNLYLKKLCSLPDSYIPLLWSANRSDTTFMPRLVTFIIDEKKMVDTLGYFPKADSRSFTITNAMKEAWEKVAKFSDGRVGAAPLILSTLKTTAPADYDAVLAKIGVAVEAYLDTVRTNIMDLIAKEKADAARGIDLDIAYATLQKQQTALSHALSIRIEGALVGVIPVSGDRSLKIDAVVINKFVNENVNLLKGGDIDHLVSRLYAIVVDAPITGIGNKSIAEYITHTKPTSAIKKEITAKISDAIRYVLLNNTYTKAFFPQSAAPTSRFEELMAQMLSKGTINGISDNVSLRQARNAARGLVDGRTFKLTGISGQSIDLGMPLFVQLKGDVSSAKSTEAATGSVAYRLGNTVIGAIQGYANSGAGFGTDSSQLETSVVASHSFGSFFVEGQIGSVSANDIHLSDWSGYRSQITVGLDTEFVSPFVQVSHRQLDRSGAFDLNETTGYVGLDMDIAKLAADTYSVDTRLLAKAGYGSKNWSSGSQDLGSTTGFSGSVEWSASLNLNSGVSFGSNLSLDTLAGSSAAVNVSLDR